MFSIIETQLIFCLHSFSYDEFTKTMDKGFPKRVDVAFSGMTGKVTAAFEYRGEYNFIQTIHFDLT